MGSDRIFSKLKIRSTPPSDPAIRDRHDRNREEKGKSRFHENPFAQRCLERNLWFRTPAGLYGLGWPFLLSSPGAQTTFRQVSVPV